MSRGCWEYPVGMTFENTHVTTRKKSAEGVPPTPLLDKPWTLKPECPTPNTDFQKLHPKHKTQNTEPGVPPTHKTLVGEGGKNEAWHNKLNYIWKITPNVGEVYAQAKILVHLVRRHNPNIRSTLLRNLETVARNSSL